MAQLVLANILAGSGNVLAGGDNSGNVTKVTIGSNLTLSGGVLSATGGGSGSVTSVAISRSGDALTITGSPITSAGTINIGFAGNTTQYIRGDGTLATLPTLGQANKLVTEVYNETGATLTKGTIVYINGGHGNLPTVTKALATSDATSAQTYGVVQADITNNNNGYVVVIGSLGDLNTEAYTNGTQLYLSGTTAGTWTSTKPKAPIHLVYVGIVVRSHTTQGVVEIKIQNGYELDELHDVQITEIANNDGIFYNTDTSLWENKTIAEVLGYTPANNANVVKLTGNQTVGGVKTFSSESIFGGGITLTGGDLVLKSGDYNTTINTDTLTESRSILFPDNSGTVALLTDIDYPVLSVFGRTGDVVAASGDYDTDMVDEGTTNLYYTNARARAALSANTGSALTYNNTTGRFTLNAAESGVDGYLTGADWDYFDSKQASLGTGTTSQFLRGDLVWAAPAPISLDQISDVDYVGTPSTGQLLRYRIDHWENWTPTYVAAGFFSATAPLSYNSTTGVFSISQATTSTNGYLSSTDWNTFNNKQSALTNPVTGTGTTNYLPKFTGTSTIGNSSINDGGGFVAINNTSGSVFALDVFSNNSAYNTRLYQPSTSTSTYASLLIQGAMTSVSAYFGIGGSTTGNTAFRDAAVIGTQSAHDLVFNTADSQKMRLFSNGNFSISTSATDAGYKLDVSGTARFTSSVTAGGTITIGNFDGQALKMQAGTATGSTYLRFYNSTGGAEGYLGLFNSSGTNYMLLDGSVRDLSLNGGSNLYLQTSGNTRVTIASTGAATFSSSVTAQTDIISKNNSSNVSYLSFQRYSNTQQYTYLVGNAEPSGYLAMHTNDTERMRITSGGNVLMNTTTSPTSGGFTNTTLLVKQVSDGGAGGGLQIEANGSDNVAFFGFDGSVFKIGTSYRTSGSYQPITFSTAGPERLRITNGGNVLIGSTTDNGLGVLQVNGNIIIAGGSSSGQAATATPTTIRFNNNYSNNYTDGSLKIYLFNSGSTIQGFTSGPAYDLQYHSSGSNSGRHAFYVANTEIIRFNLTSVISTVSITAPGFFESSDKRIKKELIDNPTSVNIENIKPKLYIKDGREELGYYAQDLQSILPSAVHEGKDGFLALSYTQVHTAKIAKLESDIIELKQIVKDLIYELGRYSK